MDIPWVPHEVGTAVTRRAVGRLGEREAGEDKDVILESLTLWHAGMSVSEMIDSKRVRRL